MNPLIAEALHLKAGPTTRSHGPWHFHGTHKYRLRSLYMHGPKSMNRPYLVVGTHCPICGFEFSEGGEAIRIADIVQAQPVETVRIKALRRREENRRWNAAHPGATNRNRRKTPTPDIMSSP